MMKTVAFDESGHGRPERRLTYLSSGRARRLSPIPTHQADSQSGVETTATSLTLGGLTSRVTDGEHTKHGGSMRQSRCKWRSEMRRFVSTLLIALVTVAGAPAGMTALAAEGSP